MVLYRLYGLYLSKNKNQATNSHLVVSGGFNYESWDNREPLK
jgi:hypothetical protein